MTLFRSAKGCVYTVRRGSSRGFYDLRPALRGSAGAPILMDGVDGGEQDSIYRAVTLEKKKYLYVFGDDFGEISIKGLALLGKSDSGGATFSKIDSYFQKHRVSRSSKPILVSLPGNSHLRCYLHQWAIGAPDHQFHAQPFMFRATAVKS